MVRVEFRNASSFLIAYSVNLSRGGVFLETEEAVEIGSEISLQLAVPNTGPIQVEGTVTWRREEPDEEGPPGIGVEFSEMAAGMGDLIDRLVSDFTQGELGLNILIVSADRQDLTTLRRMIKSIITAANVVSAPDAHVAATLLDEDVDVAIIDADSDPEGALKAVEVAAAQENRVPTILLSESEEIRMRADAAGSSEVTGNPPSFQEFRRLLVRALGRPQLVRST